MTKWHRIVIVFLIVVIVLALGVLGWLGYRWYEHDQYISRMKNTDFSLSYLVNDGPTMDSALQTKTERSLEYWQNAKISTKSFVSFSEAVFVAQALLTSGDTEQSIICFAAAEELGGSSDKTLDFYIKYAMAALKASNADLIKSLQTKAYDAISSSGKSSEAQASEKEYATKQFESIIRTEASQ